jgi:hypothetical protein
MFSKLKILTSIIVISVALSACSQEPWKGTISVEFMSSDSSAPILETGLAESNSNLIHANFTDQELNLKFKVKIQEGGEIALFAGIQSSSNGRWETISTLEQITVGKPNTISFSNNSSPNEIQEYRIAVWKKENSEEPPINFSATFKAVFWGYTEYFDAFNELRISSNVQLENYGNVADSGCRKAMGKDEVKYGSGNVAESTITECMKLLSETASNIYNENIVFQTELLGLGIPKQIQNEMINYLYSYEIASRNFKDQMYRYCTEDSLGNSYAEYCLGGFPGSEQTDQEKLDQTYSANRKALAEKFVSLGLPDFQTSD